LPKRTINEDSKKKKNIVTYFLYFVRSIYISVPTIKILFNNSHSMKMRRGFKSLQTGSLSPTSGLINLLVIGSTSLWSSWLLVSRGFHSFVWWVVTSSPQLFTLTCCHLFTLLAFWYCLFLHVLLISSSSYLYGLFILTGLISSALNDGCLSQCLLNMNM